MKKYLILFITLLFASFVLGQDISDVTKAVEKAKTGASTDSVKYWNISGMGTLNVAQAGYSNWAAGGANSLGLIGMVNLNINYSKGKHAWANIIDLAYGFQMIGIGSSDQQYNKTDDKIEITSTYGYAISENKKWYFSGLVNFRTQFSNGYKYPDDSTEISTMMAPGYLVAGIGITYVPTTWFRAYLSPVSGRFTFVLDTTLSNAGAFGVTAGKQIRGEFGTYFRADLNKDLAKNINLTSSLELFTDYLNNFGNIDVNWNVLLTMKVNKWLAASINANLIYDDDVIQATQFKEIIGVGISYKFD
ncbi:MAG: DUF3078 domain-containing protein [Bacteroidales bacterium]|nr:DUF3078 domain-containing protein [Bacteroidales bacterium]